MKNLHYLKKFVVMVLAAMMTLSTFAMPTFADNYKNTASITLTGLEAASEVTAYKVVNVSTGSDRGGTSAVIKDSIADPENPTYNEIMALVYEAGKDNDSKLKDYKLGPKTPNSGTVTFADVTPGMYIVTIKNKEDATIVYNPVVVSVNLKKENGVVKDAEDVNLEVGKGDLKDYSKLKDEDGKPVTSLKKTTIPFEKVVDREDAKNGDQDTNVNNPQVGDDAAAATGGDTARVNADATDTVLDGNRGDTAGKGDVVWYRINTMVPDYADNFFKAINKNISKDPEFEIYDKMSDGLDLNKNSITLHYYDAVAKEWKPFNTAWTKEITKQDRYFKVEFTPAGVLALRGKNVEVRYSATVNREHGYNYDAETNTGGFNYTRNPGADCKPGEEKTTYHYTFTVNGALKGPNTDENREIIKIGTDENGDFVLKETVAMRETNWRPLEGAQFDLFKKVGKDWVKDTKRSVYSDEQGILRGIDRIDAGEYKLKETKAPDGFAKNETDIEFKIEATLDSEGRMTNYKVKVHGTKEWITVGDYYVSYAQGSGNTATEIANVTYAPTATPHTTPTYKILVQKTAEEGETYMNEEGVEGTATGGELMFDKNDNDEIVPIMVEKPVSKEDFDEAANIRNSKVGTLPSTGGMGTVLFTIGGAAIMALALFLLFGGKKKQHQK